MDVAPILVDTDNQPFALFSVDDVVYGVSSANVLSISILEESTPVVNAPPYNLGIVDFRGDMIPLIGLRRLFGKPPRGGGLAAHTEGLFAEHESWHEQFESALEGSAAFPDFDSGRCGVGKWLR